MKIIKNNLYMFKLCYKAAPLWVGGKVFSALLRYVVDTVISLYFMRFIIESIENQRLFIRVFVVIIGMFAVQIMVAVADNLVCDRLEKKSMVKVEAKVLELLYGQAVKVDLVCYEDPEFYDKYTRANEQITRYASKVVWLMTETIGVVAGMIVSIAAICANEPLVILLTIIPIFVEQMLAKKYTKNKYNRDKDTTYERRQIDYVNRLVYFQEYAKEIRLTRIFAPILRSFDHAIDTMVETSKKYGKTLGIIRFCRTILSELFVYLGIQSLVVVKYIMYHAYSLGELTTILNASAQISEMLGRFSWFRSDFYESGIFIENFKIFMDYKAKITENEDGAIPTKNDLDICLDHVSFAYEGTEANVLNDVSLTIKKGERIAIVGHNGAGKSTLVKLLLRFYDVSEGSIRVGGKDIREYRLSAYRNLFGTVFQDFKIFATSIKDNVIMRKSSDEDVECVETALKKTGMLSKIKKFDKGIEVQVTKEFDSTGVLFSGGEIQKIAIARVFAGNSEICILDEPSSALDPLSEYEIFENMLNACEGKTVVFMSHRLSSTVMADRIYLFEEGCIIERGNHDELMKLNGKYAEMFRMQAEEYRREKSYERE